ncbi:MAG: MoaD/ThiS family protein [Candidatus Eremiobacteraeota bacterium]|nr:MoaD/ThiS family protein [Candidatus Eremiobacteraeota bacterium]
MQVRVLAFARLRETLQTAEVRLELPAHACIADAWAALERRFPPLRGQSAWIRIACNGRMADPNQVLLDGDEVALLPPVGGG